MISCLGCLLSSGATSVDCSFTHCESAGYNQEAAIGDSVMSEFEFVLVLMSFIVAFGASELLSGWGYVYLNRVACKPYALQLVSSVLLFFALIQSLWGSWGFRSVSWDFVTFVIALLPLLPIVGAAGIILPRATTSGQEVDSRQHYESVYHAVFSLLALWIVLCAIAEIMLLEATLHVGQFSRLLGTLILLGLCFTSKPVVHWVGLVALTTLQLVFVGVVTPSL